MEFAKLNMSALEALAVVSAVDLASAILILIAGWLISGWLSRLTYRGLNRIPHFDPTLKPLLSTLVRYAILAITILAVLHRFGVETTSVIALLGAAGLALGLALQGTLSDVAAGVMLLILRPFRVGDYIDIGTAGGTVRQIGLFTTELISADLVYVSVPNHQIFGSAITNYSREPTRRINFVLGIDYEADIDKAQNTVLEILRNDPRILSNPEPMVPVSALNASSVDLTVRCWVKNADYWDTLFDLQKQVKQAFDAANIAIPFPQQALSFRIPPKSPQDSASTSGNSH